MKSVPTRSRIKRVRQYRTRNRTNARSAGVFRGLGLYVKTGPLCRFLRQKPRFLRIF